MLNSASVLKKYHDLWKAGFFYELKFGLKIGRGFADVGFEEYSVLSKLKAVSLITGKIIDLDDFYYNYYFPVLEVDELINCFYERGWNIDKITYVEQRDWRVKICSDSSTLEYSDRELKVALLTLLIQVLSKNYV